MLGIEFVPSFLSRNIEERSSGSIGSYSTTLLSLMESNVLLEIFLN
jgi:hypothetical protein